MDFAVTGSTRVTSVPELVECLLACGPAVRLCGAGRNQMRVPPPARPAWLLRLDGLDRIERLDVGDLTCSVQAGVTHAALRAALEPHAVELACEGDGTVAGTFARGEFAPLAPGAPSARSVLLGLEGLRADGGAFKVGARVVKSVAGFDVHKAFVGSRGRLFAATSLHLKLRARPPARAHFRRSDLDAADAMQRWRALRAWSSPPRALVLARDAAAGWTLRGTIEGADAHVEQALRLAAVERDATAPTFGLDAGDGTEVVDGFVRPSRLGDLVAALPDAADLEIAGTGQFQVRCHAAAVDALLAHLPTLGSCAEIRVAAAERRGLGTPRAPGVLRLEERLRAELDPEGRLA